MESCTGGLLASLITDISGASDILKFSAVTYNTAYKIKMGVSKDIINKIQFIVEKQLKICNIKKNTRHENKLEVIESFKELFNSTINI